MNHLPLCVIIAQNALGAKEMVAIIADAHKLEQGEVGIDAHHMEAIVGACAGMRTPSHQPAQLVAQGTAEFKMPPLVKPKRSWCV